MKNGIIFNVQKYSIHDGPGIRTTVFLKGCPLNCWWCHNPESQCINQQVLFWEERCIHCGVCNKVCDCGALQYRENVLVMNKEKCTLCGKCIDLCNYNAREISGREVTTGELMKEIEKDLVFYEESGGGVTFSGGEPLLQIDFLENIVRECAKKGIHTVIDTSAYAPWENMNKLINITNLFLVDLKHMNSISHKLYTGVANEIILENIKKLSDLKKDMYIRIPIIPGINDGKENLDAIVEFLLPLNILQVNILPYHKIGMDKYKRLQIKYKLLETLEPTNEHMLDILEYLQKSGLNTKIGG